LLAYFSRAGENHYNDGRRTVQTGNTEVVAGMIRDAIGCDVYRINADDAYSDSYHDTVARQRRNLADQVSRITAGTGLGWPVLTAGHPRARRSDTTCATSTTRPPTRTVPRSVST
jgi:hypothetical protein